MLVLIIFVGIIQIVLESLDTACSNDSAADEKPGSGGTDIPAGNLPMQNVARAIEPVSYTHLTQSRGQARL